ncbi:MAG: aspartyl protease family protein [Tangfeifania sp.]
MKIKIPLLLIELEDDNYHLVAESALPDKTTGYWVVDTGASKTVFDKNLSENFREIETAHEEIHTAGIGEEPLESSVGHVYDFTLGKLKVGQLRVALLDLSHLNKFYSKATNLKICGLLGSDFMLKHKAVIDYRKKQLVLTRLF